MFLKIRLYSFKTNYNTYRIADQSLKMSIDHRPSISHDVPPTVFGTLGPRPLTTVLDRTSPHNICILGKVGIHICFGGYILRLQSVTYCFWVTLSMASGLRCRKIEEKECQELSINICTNVCICLYLNVPLTIDYN